MTAATPALALRRVVLTARPGSAVPASAAAARLIARATGVDLVGLFVEDPNLIRLAAQAEMREVGAVSGVVRVLRPAGVLAGMRLEVERMRIAVAAAVTVARGDFMRASLELVSPSVAAVLSPRSARTMGHGAAPGTAPADRATVLYDDSPGARRALDLALRLAEDDVRIEVVIAAGTDADYRHRRESALARIQASTAHRAVPRPMRVAPDALPGLVTGAPATFLILGVDGGDLTVARLAGLLDRCRGPVVVVAEISIMWIIGTVGQPGAGGPQSAPVRRSAGRGRGARTRRGKMAYPLGLSHRFPTSHIVGIAKKRLGPGAGGCLDVCRVATERIVRDCGAGAG